MSIRKLIAGMATIAALAVLAPAASASSEKDFLLEKTCADIGCTVTYSSFKGIPEGTLITYAGSGPAALVATIHAPHGTATGNCNILSVFTTGADGRCVFGSGTGSLTQFRLDVAVNVDADGLWTWDGTYWHGPGG
jgi:hypothetical protein